MTRLLSFSLTVLLWAAHAAAPANAQSPCPEGRTFSGACVNPGLAESVRKNVLVFAQPKLSYTAPPVLPSEEGTYAVPRDVGELRRIFGYDAIGTAPARPRVLVATPVLVCTTTGGGAAPAVTTCQ